MKILLIISIITLSFSLLLSEPIFARRSGGRSGSRSFSSRRTTSTRRTPTRRSTTPTSTRRTPTRRTTSTTRRTPTRRTTVVVGGRSGSRGYSNGYRRRRTHNSGIGIFGIIIILLIIFAIIYFVVRKKKLDDGDRD